MTSLAVLVVQCNLLVVLAQDFKVNLCDHEDHVTSHLNLHDHGTVFVSHVTTDPKKCDVTLHACDACRFRVELLETSLPPCTAKLMTRPTCGVTGCTYITVYDTFYGDYSNFPTSTKDIIPTFTSLSSEVRIRLCSGVPSHGIMFSLNITVEEKNELVHGRAEGTDSTGSFTSPNFPEGYALRGERFIYHLRNLEPGGKIGVTFDDWDLSPLSRMLIFEGEETSQSPLLEAYGSGFPPHISSLSSSLLIVFIADVTISTRKQYMGFRATYHFLSGNSTFSNFSTECGGHFRHSVGGLVNLRTGRQVDCVWVVYATLSFQHVRLSLHVKDKGSWQLVARKGLTSTSPLLATRSKSRDDDVTQLNLRSDTGLYMRFTGMLSTGSSASFTYMSYNDTFQDKCDDTLLQCDTIYCVSRRLACDGVRHCDDVMDEPQYCYHGISGFNTINASLPLCKPGEFACEDGRRCLPMRMHCDSWRDCADGSDENDCDADIEPAVTRPGAVSCGGGYVSCSSRDQCVAKRQLCDGHHQCWDRSDEQHCDHMMTMSVSSRHQRPWSLIIALPACLLSCLLLCLILALRMRKHTKSCRHRCAAMGRPGRLPVISRHIPHSCTSCSGRQLLQLSRSTSGASTLVDPMTSPPPYDYSRCPASPRRMDQLSPTFCQVMPIPVIVEPGASNEDYDDAEVTSLFDTARTTIT